MDEIFEFVEQSAISREDQELLDAFEPLSYWFGAFLGDGYTWYYPFQRSNKWGVGIECMDREIIERCLDHVNTFLFSTQDKKVRNYTLKSGTEMYQVRWHSKEFAEFMIHATNSKEKMPDYIWKASTKARLEFLRGLMDTDGTITSSTRRDGAELYRLIFSGKTGFVRQFPDLCRVLKINVSFQQDQRYLGYDFRLSLPDALKAGFDFYCRRKSVKLCKYWNESFGKKGGRPVGLKPSETIRSKLRCN